MAIEIPTDLIQNLQNLFRKNAGIPNYNPKSISSLPSLEELISGFEPSPSYLRCTNCNGKLLRGLDSFICVFCGHEQSKKDLLPEPIKFNETFGYRWLLNSLHLDGSEIVGPPIEENEPNRGQGRHKDEIPLSDLLNLEIKWSEQSERVKEEGDTNNSSVQSKPSLNIPGVELDNFFSESKNIVESERQPDKNLQFRETESKEVLSQTDLNFFENVKPSVDKSDDHFTNWEIKITETSKLQDPENLNIVDNVNASTNEKSVDRFSGWEDEFQSGTEIPHGISNSFDPFVGSIDDLSTHMDTVFGNVNDVKDVRPKIEQDDQWQTSSAKTPNNPMIDEEDDSFGDWNEFASSSNTIAPSDGPWKQAFDVDSNNLQNTEFGGFEQSDIFMGAFDDENGSEAVHRITDERAKDEARIGEDRINTTSSSEHEDVEMLMSQMHDLSFMLLSSLSIPKS